MSLKAWRFAALVLAALALTMESAHVLELPQKLRYDAEFYAAVNGTLYRYFAVVGAVYQIGAIVAAGCLTWMVRRRRPAFGWTLAGTAALAVALCLWLAVVAPVNREIAEAWRFAPESVPALWMELRSRWEYGHVAGFIAQLAGFCGLLISLLVETPKHIPVHPVD